MRKFVIMLVFVFVSNTALATTIRLRNGDILEGTIVERSEDVVKIDNGSGVSIDYYVDEIESVDGESLHSFLKGFQTVKQYYYCGVRDIMNMKDGISQGAHKTFYKNGKVYQEENYENGKLDGLVKIYGLNGNVQEEESYVKGRKDGVSREYNEDGKISKETNYKYGMEVGFTKLYYDDGSLFVERFIENNESSIKLFDKEGNVLKEFYTNDGKMFHKNGKVLQGLEVTRYPNGNKLLEEEFKDGVLNGISNVYYEQGNIKHSGSYVDGEPVGSFKFYNNSGRMEKEEYYEIEKGIMYEKSYYINGQLKEETFFSDNVDISHKIFDENGDIIYEGKSVKPVAF